VSNPHIPLISDQERELIGIGHVRAWNEHDAYCPGYGLDVDHDGLCREQPGYPMRPGDPDPLSIAGPEEIDENAVLLRRLDGWTEGNHDTGPLIRWAAAHLRGCVTAPRDRLPVLAAIAATLALLVIAFAVGRLTT
jgi:hypothetical protein